LSDYSVEIKPSARKALDALPDNTLVRTVLKIESLAELRHGPQGAKN